MIVILGLVILVAAGIAGVTGVLANGGHAHAEGLGDQAKGNIKQAGEKVKDAFKK